MTQLTEPAHNACSQASSSQSSPPRPAAPPSATPSPNDHGFTRSEAERLLKALTARAGLPQPLTNTRLHGREVDALWPAERLIVEVDSYAHHSSRSAFEADRARDATHAAAGYRTLRVTWRQLTETPELVAARLAAALAVRPAEPTARRG